MGRSTPYSVSRRKHHAQPKRPWFGIPCSYPRSLILLLSAPFPRRHCTHGIQDPKVFSYRFRGVFIIEYRRPPDSHLSCSHAVFPHPCLFQISLPAPRSPALLCQLICTQPYQLFLPGRSSIYRCNVAGPLCLTPTFNNRRCDVHRRVLSTTSPLFAEAVGRDFQLTGKWIMLLLYTCIWRPLRAFDSTVCQ